jgi:hypothetical protein
VGIELRSGTTKGQPYIDFSNDTSDLDIRIQLVADNQLKMESMNPGFRLVVNGDICYTNLNCNSDLRYKQNITPIPSALDKISRLRGVSFNWRREEFPDMNFSTGPRLGFIAQEIKQVLPEVVSQDQKGYYSAAYEQVVPVLVEAIKEQQNTIAQLQAQVTELAQTRAELQQSRTELATFKEKLSQIESSLQRLERLAAREENSTGRADGGEKIAGKEK